MEIYAAELAYIVRIIIAGICGIVIGFERKTVLKRRHKNSLPCCLRCGTHDNPF